MQKVEDAGFCDVIAYLNSYSTTVVAKNEELRKKTKRILKRHHAVLIWQHNLASGILWKDKKKSGAFRSYLDESVSDLSQAVLLFCHGFYKPSNLLLRSAIENIVRAIGISQDEAVLKLTNTFELLKTVRSSRVFVESDVAKSNFVKLQQHYKELCLYVHTADKDHMALTAFMHSYPCYVEKRAAEFDVRVRSAIVATCSILSIIFPTRLRSMHHKHSDAVYDILPAAVRSALAL